MPLLSGTHYCNRCGKDLFWEYSLPDRLNDAKVFQFTKGSLCPTLLNNKQSEILEFKLQCTKCSHINVFTYDNHNFCNALKLRRKHF